MIQPGTTVVVLPYSPPPRHIKVKWLPKGDKTTKYIIRDVQQTGKGHFVVFEDGIMGFNEDGRELALAIELVREVEPELDIAQLMEETMFVNA